MARLIKQSDPSAATLTTIYTVPGNVFVRIEWIMIANRSIATSYRLAISPDGAAIANGHYIAYDVAISTSAAALIEGPFYLQQTDIIRVYATLATLSFGVYGIESMRGFF